jgi:hypothetical protein
VTVICGTGSRCERHDRALHGYPCYACQQEWARRSPRVCAQIARQASGKGAVVTPAQVTAARKADAAALAAYDGPHEPVVERAGEQGPVSRLWNAVCTEGCGWSHYWLRSRNDAAMAAREHLAERGVRTGPHSRWVYLPCETCGSREGEDCTAMRRGPTRTILTPHKGRRTRRVDR